MTPTANRVPPQDPLRVALIQAPPAFLDLAGCLRVAESRLREAAAAGATLVVFPETWLPGYPLWLDEAPGAALWDHPPTKALHRCLFDNSPRLDGPEIGRLRELAGELGTDVVIGVHERDGHTLYNTMLFITDGGRALARHRKLVPTYTERLVWGRGDGSTLPVVERPWGRLGGLVCWEHWMPLARAAMHAQHETVHVAQWPWVKEMHQIASRHYAFEGRCFVLASGCRLTVDDVRAGFEGVAEGYAAGQELLASIDGPGDRLLLRAGSGVVGPDGMWLAEPSMDSADTVYAELDLTAIAEELMTLDSEGHYSRPDVFTLEVDTRPQANVRFGDGD